MAANGGADPAGRRRGGIVDNNNNEIGMNRVMQVFAVLVFIAIMAGVYEWAESLF